MTPEQGATPRTDAAAIGFAHILIDHEKSTTTELVDANFARTLERELEAAEARAGRLEEALGVTHASAFFLRNILLDVYKGTYWEEAIDYEMERANEALAALAESTFRALPEE